MPKPYYIFSSGILRRKDNTIYFEPCPTSEEAKDEEILCYFGYPDENDDGRVVRRPIPVEDIEAFYIFGELTFNTKFLNFLTQNNIPMHIFNFYGYYAGSYYPREFLNSGRLLIKQVEHYIDDELRLKLAQKFVNASSFNILRNMKTSESQNAELKTYIEFIENERTKIETAKSIPELMAIEGHIRNVYYQAWDILIVNEFFKFEYRSKRPPKNEINALLSFGNSLLYTTVLTEIYNTQLNPTISYLHEPFERRFSLALDIAEIFKPVIVDRLIFRLVNRGQIRLEHFLSELNRCYLAEEGRKIFVKEYDETLKQTVKHRGLGRNVSYKSLIRIECYKLIKHLLHDEEYKPLKVWWY